MRTTAQSTASCGCGPRSRSSRGCSETSHLRSNRGPRPHDRPAESVPDARGWGGPSRSGQVDGRPPGPGGLIGKSRPVASQDRAAATECSWKLFMKVEIPSDSSPLQLGRIAVNLALAGVQNGDRRRVIRIRGPRLVAPGNPPTARPQRSLHRLASSL